MNNKDGKVGIIIVLTIIILVALGAWFLAISKHFGLLELPTAEPTPAGDQSPAPDNPTPPAGGVAGTDDPTGSTDPEDPTDPTGHEDPDDPNAGDPHTGPDGDISTPRVLDITQLSISSEYSAINAALDAIAKDYKCAAVSLVVYDGAKKEYYTYEYGNANIEARQRVTSQTKFRIASLSKLVTAICALTLVDDGFIDLDTDISNYFGYEVKNPHFPDTPVTTRMLMQHTSSIFDSGAFLVSRDNNSTESVRYLIERGSSFRRNKPGSLFEYSNFGYAVLGALCERVSGKSLDTFAKEVLFDPLGIDAAFVPKNLNNTDNIAVMYDDRHNVTQSIIAQLAVTQTDTPGHDLHLAHANLTISALDYAKILSMIGNNGELDGVRILPSNLVNEMHKTNVKGFSYDQGLATRYSVGDFLPREGFYWHTGSSFGLFSQYDYKISPNRGVVVVTTGASITRLSSGKIDVCNDLAKAAWKVFG
ncbi:MAG: serine hydrolase [Oscillospiraceae bacterium]|nr:serine hydrolase [Oscillospiraceae bacterium]